MDDEDERYKRYVVKKWFQGKHAKSRGNWRKEGNRRGKAREFGTLFRDGMAQLLGRTEERGWQKEVYRSTPFGRRFDDVANKKLGRAMEFKAGNVTREAVRQLEKDEHALKLGRTVEWFIAPAARIDREAADKIRELREKYPNQFHVIRVTREDFKGALELGRAIAKEREQRELVKERQERARIAEREQRARDKELAQSVDPRELNEKREQVRAAVAEQARTMAEAREKGQALEIEKIRESHARITKDLADIREIERAQVGETLRGSGLGREQLQEMERHLEKNRELQRKDVARNRLHHHAGRRAAPGTRRDGQATRTGTRSA